MPQSGKLPVLNLLTGQKSGFSPAAATRRTDSSQTWQGRRARGSAWLWKISPQSPQVVGIRPKNIKNFHLLVKSRPAGATPLTDFEKLQSFIRLTILHKCFKFHVIRVTGYRVIADKPRVGQLGRIFPCTRRKNCGLDQKNDWHLFDGLDEPYHHAKSGEYRISRGSIMITKVKVHLHI